MRRTLLFTLFFVLSNFTEAQSEKIEAMMTRRYISCGDILINSTLLIPEYYAKNDLDTVSAIMNYWEENCGSYETLTRLKILLAVKADTFREQMIEGLPMINYLNFYRDVRQSEEVDNAMLLYSYSNHHSMRAFDTFTKELAIELGANERRTDLERFFLDFYSDDFEGILMRLQDSSLQNTLLGQAYQERINRYLHKPEGHFSVYSGVWIPVGNIDVVGPHPILGVQIGMKHKKLLLDGAFEFKFARSANTYYVWKDDSLYSTSHFFGGFIGAEVGYELIQVKAHELDILTGIGYDGFDALSIGDPDDPDRVNRSIGALNLNIGLEYRWYLKNRSYVGLEGRYNVVDYQNPKGTDFSGNTFTIRLKYGISRNDPRDRNLIRLDYDDLNSKDPRYKQWLKEDRSALYRY